MKRRAYRFLVWVMMAATGATLFQTYPLFPVSGNTGTGFYGCTRFAANSVGNSVDFCWLLDCENGFFGGAIDPCNSAAGAFLVDCDTYTPPDDSGTTNTSGTQQTTN